jgi:glycosyltransferase involved in cell wall biosynthesis
MIEPYRVPLFNYLHNDHDLELKVIALSTLEDNRDWRIDEADFDFDYTTLPGAHRYDHERFFPIHINWGLWSTLQEFDPDFVVNTGYVTMMNWLSLLYCRVHDATPVLWNGTTLTSTSRSRAAGGEKIVNRDSPASALREQVTTALKRQFVRESEYYLTYGTEAGEYLEFLGASSSNMERITNSVDMEWFRDQYRAAVDDSGSPSSNDSTVDLLYVGRLVEFKGVHQLLKAMARLDDDVSLTIVGSGNYAQDLRDLRSELNLSNVSFEGFQQRTDLPQYYAAADVFVFPTFVDPWGLVVNEALASGLYVLSSELAGATVDLIEEPWSGRSFSPGDVDDIARAIRETVADIEAVRGRREEISRRTTDEYDIEFTAESFSDAIAKWDSR